MKKKNVISAMAAAVCFGTACSIYKSRKKQPFMTEKELKKFNREYAQPFGREENIHPDNILLSAHCSVAMAPDGKTVNNNLLVLGGEQENKRNLMQGNLLQRNGSYIVIDKDGELLATTGKFFEDSGYDVKVLNLTDMTKSYRYNPLHYIQEEDVPALVKYFMESTGEKNEKDEFYFDSETALLEILILYLLRHQEKKNQNFSSLLKILQYTKSDFKKLDYLLDEVRLNDDNDPCVKKYDNLKNLPPEIASNVLVMLGVRLGIFDLVKVKDLTSFDELELECIPMKPSILYIVQNSEEYEYTVLSNLLIMQEIEILRKYRLGGEKQKLKYPVHFLLDNFSSPGVLPGLPEMLMVSRRLGIPPETSFFLFAESPARFRYLYPNDWEKIVFSCDTVICYHSALISSGDEISKLWGGKCKPVYTGFEKSGYKVVPAFQKEDCYHNRGKVMVIIRGQKPILDQVYEVFTHLDFDRLNNWDQNDMPAASRRILKPAQEEKPPASTKKTEEKSADKENLEKSIKKEVVTDGEQLH